MKHFYIRVRTRSSKWAAKNGVMAIFICAFADACVLPLPTPMFFVTLILLSRPKAYRYALFGTLGSLVGALIGYSIGYFAWLDGNGEFTAFAKFVFDNMPGFTESVYDNIHVQFEKWDFWILFVASLMPVPYKFFSISSGIFDVNLFLFSIATLVSQAVKFYFIALLTVKIGPKVRNLLEFNFRPFLVVASVCAVIAIILYNVF